MILTTSCKEEYAPIFRRGGIMLEIILTVDALKGHFECNPGCLETIKSKEN